VAQTILILIKEQTMKIFVAVALLSTLASMPTFAEDTANKVPAKTLHSAPSKHNPDQKAAGLKGECDAIHEMGGHHRHEMMGEHGADMMMEPDMHVLGALTLTKEQQSKINKLSDSLKHNNWVTQGLINDETAILRDLYEADQRDPVAIGKEYQKVFDLKRQMIEAYLDTQNRIEDVLTPDQRAQIKEERLKMHHMYEHSMH
jgi:Spy/CpxP family protein refolding chaperone